MRLRPPGGALGAFVTRVSERAVARRRVSSRPLLAPSVSVGNLAFGGRGKTPIVAALATHALTEGVSVAILIRGYGGASAPVPRVAMGVERAGPSWTRSVEVDGVRRPAWAWAAELGDEAPWHAAEVPGVPVVVCPDRRLGAAAVPGVDLLLLDDGGQLPVTPTVDVLCVDPRLDSPWSNTPKAQREGPGRLALADLVVSVASRGPGPPVSGVSHVLRRIHPVLVDLCGRVEVVPNAAVLLAGVGRLESVSETLRDLGVSRVSSIDLADHASPSPRTLGKLPDLPVIVTEKDAVRWAAAWGDSRIRVLRAPLEGTDVLWQAIRGQLPL